MKEILIEEYRGWDIFFYPDKERFTAFSELYDYQSKDKTSLTAARKEVDEYIKQNLKFVPVLVQKIPTRMFGGDKIRKLVGIRKDGRFTYEDKNGKLQQFSTYDERDYFLLDEDNNPIFKQIQEVEEEIATLEKLKRELEGKVKKVGLDTLKEKYKSLID